MIASRYKCYQYTHEEEASITNEDGEKEMCEAHQGFVFSKGDDSLAPGCNEKCWCCQPSKIYFHFSQRILYTHNILFTVQYQSIYVYLYLGR